MSAQFGAEELSWFGSLRERVGSVFPERQVHLRTNGRISYFRIGTSAQIFTLALAIAAGWWVGYASLSYVKHERIVAVKESQITNARLAYHSLLSEVAEYQNKFTSITNDLERNHAMMLGLVERNAKLRTSLRSISSELHDTKNDRAHIVSAREALSDTLAELKNEKGGLVERNAKLRASLRSISDELRDTQNDRAHIVSAREALSDKLAELKNEKGGLVEHNAELQTSLRSISDELRDTQNDRTHIVSAREALRGKVTELEDKTSGLATRNFVLKENLDTVESGLQAALSERNQARFQRSRMKIYVKQLETRLADLQQSYEVSVQRLTERTVTRITDLEHVISLAGIDPSKLARNDERTGGQGGPFIPVETPDDMPAGELKKNLDTLDIHLARLNTLQSAMRNLPLTAPLRSYYITSGYGKRRDPLNKRWAAHYGVDFGSTRKAKIHATAPGVVRRAGWKGRYGRYIEIDHGNGMITRYGHLHKIYVKRGQKVKFQQKIGLLGNSGRATGPHLHYETVFKKRSINPLKFIKAGRHVFQR